MSRFSFLFTAMFAFALITISPASVRAENTEHDCVAPESPSALNHCALRNFKNADTALNRLMPQAEAQNHFFSKDLPADEKKDAGALLEAQRAWVVFRDSHCKALSLSHAGGSFQPLVFNGCRARLTFDRIRQLQELIRTAKSEG